MIKPAVIVPTVRDDSIARWLKEWAGIENHADVYIIEDRPKKTLQLPEWAKHYSWLEIDQDLLDRSWIIPRKTDCIRSYGYLRAYHSGHNVIITLDDDCYPMQGTTPEQFIDGHLLALSDSCPSPAWMTTIDGVRPRGIPYANIQRTMPCVLNHGLWQNVPDLDAVTQLSNMVKPVQHTLKIGSPYRGMYYPMCGMNIAFNRTIAPAMYFLLMGEAHGVDRFGDIWCGIISKRICDQLGYAVNVGDPVIWHSRASNVWANLRKEAVGMEQNETFWLNVDRIVLSGKTVVSCYRQIADGLSDLNEYWNKTSKAMHQWISLF